MLEKLFWLKNRLKVMSIAEVVFRAGRAVQQLVEQLYSKLGLGFDAPDWQHADLRLGVRCSSGASSSAFESLRNPIAIKKLLENEIDFFGLQYLAIPEPSNWHCDPLTQTVAPKVLGKRLDYRNESLVGNPKYLWEWARHQHLIPLAAEYVCSKDSQLLIKIAADVDTWVEQNPMGIGIHWCSSLESGLRLIAWALIHILLSSAGVHGGLFGIVKDDIKLRKSIFEQARFIRGYLSRFSSANNHLIGELTGLWVSSQVFGMGDKGKAWASFAQRELETESVNQVFSDGVNKEQAIYYHYWVLDYFLIAWVVAQSVDKPFSVEFEKTIEKMAVFLKNVSLPSGEPPQIGDADNGFVARFAPTWPENPFSEVILAVQHLMDKPMGVLNGCAAKAIWYGHVCGKPYTEGNEQHESRAIQFPLVYDEGGYAVLSNNRMKVVFDAGPLGYPEIAAHGHADALSFTLAIDDKWWLVDPGTYSYHTEPKWRDYFRGTSAHNTVRLKQQNQSQIGGPFLWLAKASSHFHSHGNRSSPAGSVQYIKGEHDGYKRTNCNHSRTIELNESVNILEIYDTIKMDDSTLVELYFHFHPDVEVHQSESARFSCTCDGAGLDITVDPNLKWEIVNGATEPILGWYSAGLGQKVPCVSLVGRVVSARCIELKTSFVLAD